MESKKNVGFVLWKDTKLVSVLSTAYHPKQKASCERTLQDGSRKTFPCPLSLNIQNVWEELIGSIN